MLNKKVVQCFYAPVTCKDTSNCREKSEENKSFKPNQIAPSIYIMIELCFFSLDQWEIKIHLLWGKCFNIPHWPRSHSTNRRLQHIEKLSKTYSGDPHLDQTKLNGLLLLTIHGVLKERQGQTNDKTEGCIACEVQKLCHGLHSFGTL